jgi:RsiW-degrading membrane proteinase PrsW (M82 family)
MEAKKFILPAAVLIALATNVAAIDFLTRLRDLDQGLLCVIVTFVPGVLVMFLIVAGLIYIIGDEGKRVTAKNLIKNAILGLLLVFIFVMMSMALVPTITLEHCLG